MVRTTRIAEVQQVRCHRHHPSPLAWEPLLMEHHPWCRGLPRPRSFSPKSGFSVGVPAAVVHPLSAIGGFPRHGPRHFMFLHIRQTFLPLLDFQLQFPPQGLVGVQAQDKRMGCLLSGPVFLVCIRSEGTRKNLGAKGRGQILGAVGGAGIDHHNFIHNAHKGCQAPWKVLNFIVGDDDCTQHKGEGTRERGFLWKTSRPARRGDGVILSL